MREKGFVTTLGSDLPSLIPLVVGLVVFFGMLQFSLTNVGNKNDELDLFRDALSIGDIVRGDGLLTQGDLGNNSGPLCDRAKSVPTNFIAGITDFDNLNRIELIGADEDYDTVGEVTSKLFRFSSNIGSAVNEFCFTGDSNTRIDAIQRKIVLSYPTIYQNPSASIDDLLDFKYVTVIVWK